MSNLGDKLINTKDGLRVIWLDIWIEKTEQSGFLCLLQRLSPNPGMSPTMSQEQLRIRRMNLIEGTKFGRPFHENFMLFGLRIWLVIAPILFVALTSSEVAYILTHLVPAGDRNGTTIIWAGAIFIDVAMMFVTFGVAIKRRDVSEKRETWGAVSKREEVEMWFGTGIWLVFAVINIISQSAFLMHIILLSGAKDVTLLYVFVASRVVGFILESVSLGSPRYSSARRASSWDTSNTPLPLDHVIPYGMSCREC